MVDNLMVKNFLYGLSLLNIIAKILNKRLLYLAFLHIFIRGGKDVGDTLALLWHHDSLTIASLSLYFQYVACIQDWTKME